MQARLAISGLGGSGTRVFAELIRRFGYHIGEDLNEASDNLWWTLLFKRRSILLEQVEQLEWLYDVFANRMESRTRTDEHVIFRRIGALAGDNRIQHPARWLQQRADSFLASSTTSRGVGLKWGWKEPNTHILADFLLQHDPKLSLIHVVRDPIYMSFSSNQNQLEFWGPALFGSDIEINPFNSLAYWCRTHARLEAIAHKFLGRLTFVSHEYACECPINAIDALAGLVGVDLASEVRDSASMAISGDRLAMASDEQRAYPFSNSDIQWATDFMQRNFGSPISRLYRPHR